MNPRIRACLVKLFLTLFVLPTSALAENAELTADQRVAMAIEARNVESLRAAIRAGGHPNGFVKLVGQPYAIEQQNRALYTGDPKVIGALLDAGADLNVGLPKVGCRPDIIQLYLDHGAAIDAHPPGGTSLLFQIVQFGPRQKSEIDWPPEREARHAACLRTADYLISRGAKIQGQEGQRTPLMDVVSSGDLDYLKLFTKAGADFNEQFDPVLFNPFLLQALYEYAFSVSPYNTQRGVDLRSLKVIEFMLKHGADPNLANGRVWNSYEDFRRYPYMAGETPLAVAARYGWYDVASLLLQNGANPFIGRALDDGDSSAIPSDIAITNGHAKTAALIKRFEAHSRGASVPPAAASASTPDASRYK